MELDLLYRVSVEGWIRAVRGLAPEHWDLPTPCTDWTVRDLVNHVAGEDLWTTPLLNGSTIADVGDRFDGDVLGGEPIEGAVAAAEEALVTTEQALPAGGTVHLSYGEEQVEEYVRQLAADHLIHSWDLAAAVGAPRGLDPAAVATVSGWFAEREELYRGAGIIADRVVVAAAGSDPQADLVAGFGRDPAWSAGRTV